MIVLRECRKCGYQGPLTAFERCKSIRFGRRYECLTCWRGYRRAWYKAHYDDPEKKAARNEYHRYLRHNDPKYSEYCRKHRRESRVAKRVAKVEACMERQLGLCPGRNIYHRCLVELEGLEEQGLLHLDHIQPYSRGGSDDLDNLQAMCQPCNLSKRSKTMVEWSQEWKVIP